MSQLLSPETEALIREMVDGDRYPDAEAVVREALRLLEERDKIAVLRALVAEADAEFERGEFLEWTPELMEQLRQEAVERVRQGRTSPDAVTP